MDGLWSLAKCPDLVVNKGHYFGTRGSPTSRRCRTRTSAR